MGASNEVAKVFRTKQIKFSKPVPSLYQKLERNELFWEVKEPSK